MENPEIVPVPAQASRRPKGIKSVDVRRLRRQGYSVTDIGDLLGITQASVSYHLNKKSKNKTEGKMSTVKDSTVQDTAFEAELFGTIIKLDRTPRSIERIGNKIIIS